MQPGSYRVEVSQKGFKKIVRELALQVAQVGAEDFKLDVGEITQSITVKAGSPVMNSAEFGHRTSCRRTAKPPELPLNGRNFTQVCLLGPGVTRGNPTGAATGANNNAETFRFGQSGGASLAVNGLRPQNNNFILDGIDNNEALVNTIVFFPPAEAIDEFRVQTSGCNRHNSAAQEVRSSSPVLSLGPTIIMAAHSGSTGTRTSMLEAFSKALQRRDLTAISLAGTVGGPVIKNKFFPVWRL